MDDDEHRTQGVELGQIADALDEVSYPIDSETLVERYGDYEIDLEDGESTLGEVLRPEAEVTFESRAEVERRILSMVGSDAVGREGYSDRGGSTPGIDGGNSQ